MLTVSCSVITQHVNLIFVIIFFKGDLLAREFEAGQSMGGHYPCHCGAVAAGFSDPSLVLKPCHYCSIRERAKEFEGKPEGFTFDTKKLSVSPIYL
jgi:hypothetical protein